jgi:hypothetical protein
LQRGGVQHLPNIVFSKSRDDKEQISEQYTLLFTKLSGVY